MRIDLNIRNLLSAVEENVVQMENDGAPFNIELYISRNLPIKFPNKGIIEFVESSKKIQIHHELFNTTSFLENHNKNTIESLIDLYGSSHQRDYCLVISGHRFNDEQTIEFRGILGINRLYKIILMLRLIGFDQNQLKLLDHKPDYEKIIENDINQFPVNTELVVVGGQVAIGKMLGKEFILNKFIPGNIISFGEYTYKGKSIVLTTFPYGDLCEPIVRCLSKKKIKAIVFVGSAGTLTDDIKIGDIVVPNTIIGTDGRIKTNKFFNRFRELEGRDVKFSCLHTSVITPLIETISFVAELKKIGCETIDVEAGYFQNGCENWLQDSCKVGLMLYITDRPHAKKSIAEHDYSDLSVKIVRERMASILKDSLKTFIND